MIRDQQKSEQIVQAAVKRLAHFGIQKTTLSEIAEDVGVTKQALHYYFTDKQALINAVLSHISDSYLQTLAKQLDSAGDFEEVLIQLVETRYKYFRNYYMVIAELLSTDTPRTPELAIQKEDMRKKEQDVLYHHFKKAVSHHEVKPANGEEIITLVQDIIDAIFHAAHFSFTIQDDEQVKQVIHKQKRVIHLLYRGMAA